MDIDNATQNMTDMMNTIKIIYCETNPEAQKVYAEMMNLIEEIMGRMRSATIDQIKEYYENIEKESLNHHQNEEVLLWL